MIPYNSQTKALVLQKDDFFKVKSRFCHNQLAGNKDKFSFEGLDSFKQRLPFMYKKYNKNDKIKHWTVAKEKAKKHFPTPTHPH